MLMFGVQKVSPVCFKLLNARASVPITAPTSRHMLSFSADDIPRGDGKEVGQTVAFSASRNLGGAKAADQ